MEVIEEAVGLVTSKKAQRTVLGTVLLTFASVLLLFFSVIVSLVFYSNYVPDRAVTHPIYLQYGSGPNPFGSVSLASPSLKQHQDYDVSVTLSLPLSPPNTQQGNFMISLYLLAAASHEPGPDAPLGDRDVAGVLFRSRRPALVPYQDPVTTTASRLLFVLYHVFFPGASHTYAMDVALAERVRFDRSAGVPRTAYVEVEAGQSIQTYRAEITFTARLSGLRWVLYTYRILSIAVMIWLFWACEVFIAVLTWMALAGRLRRLEEEEEEPEKPGAGEKNEIKREDEEVSDSSRTFPTYGRQPPLRYEPKVKQEEEREERPLYGGEIRGSADVVGDADDEDESDRAFDSGLGTSQTGEGSSQAEAADDGRTPRRRLSRRQDEGGW